MEQSVPSVHPSVCRPCPFSKTTKSYWDQVWSDGSLWHWHPTVLVSSVIIAFLHICEQRKHYGLQCPHVLSLQPSNRSGPTIVLSDPGPSSEILLFQITFSSADQYIHAEIFPLFFVFCPFSLYVKPFLCPVSTSVGCGSALTFVHSKILAIFTPPGRTWWHECFFYFIFWLSFSLSLSLEHCFSAYTALLSNSSLKLLLR